jgi:hypothetical protein
MCINSGLVAKNKWPGGGGRLDWWMNGFLRDGRGQYGSFLQGVWFYSVA